MKAIEESFQNALEEMESESWEEMIIYVIDSEII
jgi:hypothetical protein